MECFFNSFTKYLLEKCTFRCINFLWKVLYFTLQCSATVCNPFYDLNPSYPDLWCLPRFEIPARFVIFLHRFEIPKATHLCNPSCPNLYSLKSAPIYNSLIASFCNLKNFFLLFRFFFILILELLLRQRK